MEVLTKEVIHFDQVRHWQKIDVKRRLLIYFFQRATISQKVNETNPSFHVKWHTTRQVLLLTFGTFSLLLTIFFLVERMGTRLSFFSSLDTSLIFTNILRFSVLSHSSTRDTTHIYDDYK